MELRLSTKTTAPENSGWISAYVVLGYIALLQELGFKEILRKAGYRKQGEVHLALTHKHTHILYGGQLLLSSSGQQICFSQNFCCPEEDGWGKLCNEVGVDGGRGLHLYEMEWGGDALCAMVAGAMFGWGCGSKRVCCVTDAVTWVRVGG